ncbi:hypothetical protein Tco_1358573 [Tanacetum coccineum]
MDGSPEVAEGALVVDEGRLEEDVHGLRGALREQREILDSIACDFSRFTTRTVTELSRMMDQAGVRYQDRIAWVFLYFAHDLAAKNSTMLVKYLQSGILVY